MLRLTVTTSPLGLKVSAPTLRDIEVLAVYVCVCVFVKEIFLPASLLGERVRDEDPIKISGGGRKCSLAK